MASFFHTHAISRTDFSRNRMLWGKRETFSAAIFLLEKANCVLLLPDTKEKKYIGTCIFSPAKIKAAFGINTEKILM